MSEVRREETGAEWDDGRATCLAAAAALRGERPADAAVEAFLTTLGYGGEQAPLAAAEREQRGHLLDVAAQLSRMFPLVAPDAPGLAVLGAEVDPRTVAPWLGDRRQSVSGTGIALGPALETCLGEAVEFLSGFEQEIDAIPNTYAPAREVGVDGATVAMVEASLAACGKPRGTAVDWVPALRLHDGASVLLPADIAFRRAPERRIIEPTGPLSLGCAAGATFGAAVLHALLELVERDAAALWWRGGRRGRSLPLESPALAGAVDMLRRLRGDRSDRRTWLLDITTDLELPTVAAVSFLADGRGFCCGTATRTSLLAACQSALREMCQMELAHHVVQAKRQARGDAALNALDLHHIRRFTEIDATTCALVHPLPPVGASPEDAPELVAVVRRLAERGLYPSVIDQTRARFGVPVARVVCPGLEQDPSMLIGERLRAAIAETGGGETYSKGVPSL